MCAGLAAVQEDGSGRAEVRGFPSFPQKAREGWGTRHPALGVYWSAMDTSVTVSMISGAAGISIAAVTYFLAKKKEREADWRKYKFEQYKEFLTALSRMIGQIQTPEDQRCFAEACNTLYLIGTNGVLEALQNYRDTIMPSRGGQSDMEHNRRLSLLIWEIRKDVGIPGTPDASNFTARLWRADANYPIPSNWDPRERL